MALLNREAILQAQDLVVDEVEVPQWGGSVKVRSLTGAERGRIEVSIIERKGVNHAENMSLLRARMVSLSVVDEEGRRVFSERDVDALNSKNAAALQVVFNAAMKLSGFSREDAEELTKNSEPIQKEDSVSA